MKHESDIRSLLISNAIHLISEGGFEKATTKELTYYKGDLPDFKMNEVYIYRLYGSKEALYEAVFASLDMEMYNAIQSGLKKIGSFEKHTKEKFYEFFLLAWQFVLKNEDRCRCYVRYYYSVYFIIFEIFIINTDSEIKQGVKNALHYRFHIRFFYE